MAPPQNQEDPVVIVMPLVMGMAGKTMVVKMIDTVTIASTAMIILNVKVMVTVNVMVKIKVDVDVDVYVDVKGIIMLMFIWLIVLILIVIYHFQGFWTSNRLLFTLYQVILAIFLIYVFIWVLEQILQ